jgi:hypothetical protein
VQPPPAPPQRRQVQPPLPPTQQHQVHPQPPLPQQRQVQSPVTGGTSEGCLSVSGSTVGQLGCAAVGTGNNAVSIVTFGADPTGVNDSTAAIQAAIDYVAKSGGSGTSGPLREIFCPDGIYKVSKPLYLDPPDDLRNAPAWNVGTNYAINSVVSYGGIAWKSTINGNLGNTPALAVWPAAGNWTPWAAPSSDNHFQLSFTGTVGLGSGGNHRGCDLQYTFNNAPLFIVGPGQGMYVGNLTITGNINAAHSNIVRGLQSALGIGIAVSGDGGGTQRWLVENVEINNVYVGIETSWNSDGLGAEGTVRKSDINNCEQGWVVVGSQNFINNAEEVNFGCTANYVATAGPGIAVHNANISTEIFANANIFTLGGSTLTATLGPINTYTLTTTLSGGVAPNGNVATDFFIASCNVVPSIPGATPNGNCVYNAWIIKLPGWGPVPMTMTTYNFSTHAATFVVDPNWKTMAASTADLSNVGNFDFKTEMQAATSIYAVEMFTIFTGNAFHATHDHLEQVSCTQLINDISGFNGDHGNTFSNILFQYNIGMDSYDDRNIPLANQLTDPRYGYFLCQESKPFINIGLTGGASINFEMSQFDQGGDPIVITNQSEGADRCSFGFQGSPMFQVSVEPVSNNNYYNLAQGVCDWKQSPFVPFILFGTAFQEIHSGGGMYGFNPSPWTTPRLPGNMYTVVQSITGANAIGSYPPIYGNTIYSVHDLISTSLGVGANTAASKFVESKHGWASYGRNLTTSDNASLSWKYVGGSNVVQMDATTLTWMFPGLSIILDNGSGPVHYLVTGVYPHDSLDGGTHAGYVRVVNPDNLFLLSGGGVGFASNPQLAGTAGTTYTGTTIGQDAYSWVTATLL